jgi:hypothetical protein
MLHRDEASRLPSVGDEWVTQLTTPGSAPLFTFYTMVSTHTRFFSLPSPWR